MKKRFSRRQFLNTASITAAALSAPSSLHSAADSRRRDTLHCPQNGVILFQGDSITDWGRDRTDSGCNTSKSLGSGYPLLTAGKLLSSNPAYQLRIYNRAISGDKVFQLADRLQQDVLDIHPDVLSILIGVNDFWHTLDFNYHATVKIFKDDYTALLTRVTAEIPDIRLVIGEPFALKGVKTVNDRWFPEFHQYQAAASSIAKIFHAGFIPYQKIFDDATRLAPAPYWTEDGVHPTLAGAELMSEAWVKWYKTIT